MKQYQITFNVPDDFNPEEMSLNADYKDDISIASEGFSSMEEDIRHLLESGQIHIEKNSISDHDVVLFKFDQQFLKNADAPVFLDQFRASLEKVCGCPVIGFLNDIDVLVENADQAIDMLNGMIAKIKVRSAVGNAGKIILPN